jgi:phage FluMu gp28-like protein
VRPQLRDELRKPERVTSPGGNVSIAATRDAVGHADHFWSFALAVDAATEASGPLVIERVERPPRLADMDGMRREVLL